MKLKSVSGSFQPLLHCSFHACLWGWECNLSCHPHANCFCRECSHKVALAKTPSLMAPQVPTDCKRVLSSPRFLKHLAQRKQISNRGNKLATKSIFSHVHASTLARVRQMSHTHVCMSGRAHIHTSQGTHVHRSWLRDTSILFCCFPWA